MFPELWLLETWLDSLPVTALEFDVFGNDELIRSVILLPQLRFHSIQYHL